MTIAPLTLVLATLFAQDAQVPRALTANIARLGLDGSIAAHCEGSFEANRRAHAVALGPAGSRGGRYLIVPAQGDAVELASYTDGADLSCYTPSQARAINKSIAMSETIAGKVSPRFNSTVVCGFVEATTARCWQYSPSARRFIVVGEWHT